MILMFIIFLVLLLSIIMGCVIFLMGKKSNYDYEMMSPFECGFLMVFSCRMGFSLSFFLIALIFGIFDLELILIFPVIFNYFKFKEIYSLFSVMIFILILILGLCYEWNLGSLEWKK